MVIGVSLIFHFYHRQLYLLEIGAQIKFDEITRHIDFIGEDEVKVALFYIDVSSFILIVTSKITNSHSKHNVYCSSRSIILYNFMHKVWKK